MSEKSTVKVIAIVAMDEGRVIGNQQTIPWHIPGEQKRFAELTKGHTVLMGRKTYDSLPEKFRPLPKRKNVVLTRNPENFNSPSEVEVISDLELFFKELPTRKGLPSDQLWVIGGQNVYEQTLQYCNQLCVTLVPGFHEGDSYFPDFESEFKVDAVETYPGFEIRWYSRNCE